MKPYLAKAAAVFAGIFVGAAICTLGLAAVAFAIGTMPTVERNLLNVVVLAIAAITGVAAYRWIKRKWLPSD